MEEFVTQGLWPDEERGPFLLVMYWAPFEGRFEVHGIELRSTRRPEEWGEEPYDSLLRAPADELDPPEPLTTPLLRRLKLRELANKHRADARFMLRFGIKGDVKGREERARLAAELEGVKRRGRTGWGPRHYKEVADVYELALQQGRPDPTRAVAEFLKGTKASYVKGGMTNYAQASKHVRRARDLGFLPPTKKGAKP